MKILITISLILNILTLVLFFYRVEHQNKINEVFENNIKFSLDYSNKEFDKNGYLKRKF